MILTAQPDVDGAIAAADKVVQQHWALVEFLRPGLSLAEIDEFIARTLKSLRCKSAFLRYRIPGHPPYPSHACLSLNDCIVHGTHLMHNDPIRPGDLLSIDVGVIHRGWVGDAAWTYAIGERSEEAARLMECGKTSLRLGVEAMKPGRPLIDWARAVQSYVEGQCRYHLVRGLGGHGYGRKLHGPPYVSNVVPINRTEWPDAWTVMEPGMLLAVEPMISTGTPEIQSRRRSWPIHTPDGSLSVHYEADVLITDDGPRNLTVEMFDLPDVVGARQ